MSGRADASRRTVRRPELIFFDVGETLIRPDPSWVDVYLRALARFGLRIERGELQAALARATWEPHGPFEASEAASYDLIKAFDAAVLAELGYPDLPDEVFRAIAHAFASRDSWLVFPDVVPALDALAAAGIRRAVISNWTWSAPQLLHDLDLASRFETLIISARVGLGKPSREIFQHALDVTGVAPDAAMHVGDSYRSDVLGARGAGIDGVLLLRDQRIAAHAGQPQAHADVPIVGDLLDLLDLVSVPRPAATGA